MAIVKQLALALSLMAIVAGRVSAQERFITDTLTSNNDRVTLPSARSSTAMVTVSGTWVGTLTFQRTGNAGVTYGLMPCLNEASGVLVTTATANSTFMCASGGAQRISVLMSPYTSGTATVTIYSGEGVALVSLIRSLPAGTATIGAVTMPAASHPCTSTAVTSVIISTATSGNVQLVPLSGSTVIYVCGFNFIANGTVSVQMISGTGTACATGETDMTGAYALEAQTGISVPNGGGYQYKTAAGGAACIELSAAVQVSGLLTYVQQ